MRGKAWCFNPYIDQVLGVGPLGAQLTELVTFHGLTAESWLVECIRGRE